MSAMLDYMQLCRLCLVKEKVNVPIFGDENDVRQIFLKITACLPVKVTQEDNLPKKICDACLYKVDLLYQFWNTTVNAEKQLIQWLTEIGVDVNIKNSDTQTLPILPQSHAHPHSIPAVVPELKEERPDIAEKQPEYQMPEQPNMYPSYDNLGYPQAEVTMEVGTANTFVQPEPVEDPPPPPDPPAPTPKKRGRPAGVTNKKSPPKKKATPAPPPVVISPRTNSTRRSSATAAAAAVAAAAAAATDSEEDSDGDRLGGLDYEDSDSDEDHIPKEEMDSDEDYVKPKSFLGVPSSADGEQPGPSGLGGVKSEGSGANATESGNVQDEWEHDYSFAINNSIDTSYELILSNKEQVGNILTEIESIESSENVLVDKTALVINHMASEVVGSTTNNLDANKEEPIVHITNVIKNNETITQAINKDHKCYTVRIRGQNATHQCVHTCDICRKEFRNKDCAKFCQEKLKKKLDVDIPNNRFYLCEICGRHFFFISAFIAHYNHKHSDKNLFLKHKQNQKCNICGKLVSTKWNLKAHMMGHLDVRPYLCEFCGKSYKKQNLLRMHARTHTGNRPYHCTICPKKFSYRGVLSAHLRTHTGERPFACEFCNRRYTGYTALKIHRREHTGEKPYRCDLCPSERAFTSKRKLLSHLNQPHHE